MNDKMRVPLKNILPLGEKGKSYVAVRRQLAMEAISLSVGLTSEEKKGMTTYRFSKIVPLQYSFLKSYRVSYYTETNTLEKHRFWKVGIKTGIYSILLS